MPSVFPPQQPVPAIQVPPPQWASLGATDPSATAPRNTPAGPALLALAIVLGAAGVVVNMQPVSLLSGTSTLYFGVVLVAISLVLVLVVKAPRMGFRMLAVVLVVLCSVVVAANTVYVQIQLNDLREQLFEPFGN